jgi:4-alpha-glucanotransferase
MGAGDEAAIERLAALAGIEPGYYDTEGRFRPTTPTMRRAVLRTLGHDPGSPAAVLDAIAAHEEAPWRPLLPPVAVLRPAAGHAPHLGLVVPESALAGPLAWRIVLEDGAQREGSLRPADLPVLARRGGGGGGTRLRLALPLPEDLPPGYHLLEAELGPLGAATRLILAPAAAWLPEWLAAGLRAWGFACPLFSLWSERSWGIGDFSDLAGLARLAGTLGARLIGLNPLHAPLPGAAADPNPYLPSSRRFLNPLHIAVPALAPGAVPSEALPEVAAGVDYPLVHRVKHAALESLYRAGGDVGEDAPDLATFRREGGEALARFALFNALAERFAPRRWRDWPAAVRSPDAPGIAEFRREQAERIDYHIWLQWIAERQLGAVAAEAGAAGLYRDLAVGVHPEGADVWADPAAFLTAARFGAPPDAFNPEGQDWGLPPPDPAALRAEGYAGFIAAIQANMRHAVALRIDHVMGLQRLYVVPAGGSARSGAYLRYPMEDLLGILALESHRHRCLLVGEDLGTVPDGFRERLAEARVLSCRLLLFERWENGMFHRPGAYPRLAAAAFATHDLPTIRGWWDGCDLPQPSDAPAAVPTPPDDPVAARRHARGLLLAALRDRGLAPAGVTADTADEPEAMAALIQALHVFLARSPAGLVLANLGDLLAETAQINRPGTAGDTGNWRHRYRLPVEALAADGLVRCLVEAVAAARSGPVDAET